MTLDYRHQLEEIQGKTIAIIYFFEGEEEKGAEHYWIWKSDIISGWLNAVQELKCRPYILDVRTFIQKAINKTLPILDFVLNLNCGSYELSSMALVPSMCSFLGIPCIPCNAASIVVGENKNISNLLATAMGLNVPRALTAPSKNGIYRPLNLGSSMGIKLGEYNVLDKEGTYQEFIPGYDITIPIVYNPITDDIDLLPPLIYIPHSKSPQWIYDTLEKYSDNPGFSMYPLSEIEQNAKEKLLNFAHVFPIQTFGRIDARILCDDKELSDKIFKYPLTIRDFYFIEMNSMPTIEKEDSFEMAYKAAMVFQNHSLHNCICEYNELVKNPTMVGFILSASILALSKAKFQNQTDSNHDIK